MDLKESYIRKEVTNFKGKNKIDKKPLKKINSAGISNFKELYIVKQNYSFQYKKNFKL